MEMVDSWHRDLVMERCGYGMHRIEEAWEPSKGHKPGAKSVSISDDGELVASGSVDSTTPFWEYEVRRATGTTIEISSGHGIIRGSA